MSQTSQHITDIPLSKLVPSDLNMRKSEASKADNEKLRSSIKAYGIKQNLIVFPGSKKGTFEVVAGQRRYTQAKILADQKHFKKTYVIPCQIAQSKQEAIELSIIENTHRAAAHPADEFEAYNAAKLEGSSVKDISDRFGVTQRHVKQRLKMAGIAPEIIQRFRQGKITLEAVMAFTVESDHKRQLDVLAQLGTNTNEHQIKKALTNNAYTSAHFLVKFVGLDAYKKAGGDVSTDLFSTTTYIHSNEILEGLAQAKLEKLAAKHSQGWKWFKTYPQLVDNNTIYSYTEIQGQPPEELTVLKTEVEAEYKVLDDKFYEADLSDEEQTKYEALETQLNELEKMSLEQLTFVAEEQALAGFIIYLSAEGAPSFYKGLVHKSDQPALDTLQGTVQGDGSNKTGTSDPENTANEGAYSQSLRSDLAACRQAIAQGYLAQSPELALDLLQYSFCLNILSDITNSFTSTPLNISSSLALDTANHEHAQNHCEALVEAYSTLSLSWTKSPNDSKRFETYQALSIQDKSAITAYCTAVSLQVGLKDDRSVGELIINQLSIPWEDAFTPTKANFLNRIPKPIQIEIGKEFMPDTWAEEAGTKKKSLIAEELELAMTGKDDRLNEKQVAAACAWLPNGFI